LRAILKFARNEGWLDYTPFERASTPIISKADETKRNRVMSFDEEKKLLEACADDTPRAHLRPLIIAAVNTGARKGELLSLTWKDVDLASGIITIRALNTKTAQSRSLPISDRLSLMLGSLQSKVSGTGRRMRTAVQLHITSVSFGWAFLFPS